MDTVSCVSLFNLQGHNKELRSVCWNPNGEYLASVSNDVVKVWSSASGECIHELRSDGINFNCCIFHPASPGILLVGGYQVTDIYIQSIFLMLKVTSLIEFFNGSKL